MFYLLQQDGVAANGDGTISVSSIERKRFREISRGLWQEVDGTRLLRVTDIGGRRTILDSHNPVGVLQAVPASRNAKLFQSVVGASVAVLLLTVIFRPVGWWVRRRHAAAPVATGRAARVRLFTRLAALADLVYLFGWYRVLAPILDTRVEVYNNALDGTIRTLQVAAVIPIVAAAIGVGNLVMSFRQSFGWGVRVRAAIVCLALLGVLWIATVAHLIGWSLNY